MPGAPAAPGVSPDRPRPVSNGGGSGGRRVPSPPGGAVGWGRHRPRAALARGRPSPATGPRSRERTPRPRIGPEACRVPTQPGITHGPSAPPPPCVPHPHISREHGDLGQALPQGVPVLSRDRGLLPRAVRGAQGRAGRPRPTRDRDRGRERQREWGRHRPRHVGRVIPAGRCGPGRCGQGPGAPPGGAAVPAAPVAARGPRGLRGGRSGGGSGRLSHPRGRRARRPDPGPALPAEPPEEGEQSAAGTWRAPGRRRPRLAPSRAPRGPRPSSSSERGRGRARARRGAGPGLLHHRRSRPRKKMKIFSESHKTVFVVDHCPYMAESCRQHVEFDMLVKNRTQGIIPLAPISKSLWTCSVESSMEYCRIMYDIFPFKKLVNFIVSDSGAHVLNSWTQEDQNLQELMAALAAVGPPNPRADPECCSILHGLVAAVEALCKITEYQHEARTTLMENAERVGNRGRIICITNAKSDSHVRMLEDCVQETIHEHNKLAANSDHLMQIQKCELVLIHTYPVGEDSLVSDRPKKELSPVLTSEVHSVRAGRHLATKLNLLVQQHFDLASTTITNIPMKEEQHANTSANYDVELLHHKEAHVDFLKSGDNHMGGNSREGTFKETVTLKWCTPRTNSVELHYCTGAYRISPVDVNSRPSSCLTNFLLNGRSVLLEQPRKSGSKVISHMLSSHGGEIFLHVLSSSRSILEDPPSISEGCGGRVTDYRITDFGEFMRENRLTPFLEPRYKIDGSLEIPLERAKDQLEKHTRYWPMIISQTTIFNMQAVVPLASVIVKEAMTDEDVLNCQKTIYNLVDMERKNDPLPISTVGTRGKGPKRDEQYRIMWNELETLVRAHINNSDKHQRVLECLMACRSKPPEEEERKKRGRKREDKEDKSEKLGKDYESDKPWQESERLKGLLDREKEELAEAEVIKDSPDSPEPPNKKPLITMDEMPTVEKAKGPMSLLSLWSNRINTANSRKHQEFIGRLNSVNNKAELYQHLKEENGMETTENGKAGRQ